MAKNLGVGKQLYEFIAEFGEGGGIDLPDCAIGSLCAQIDVETANFLDNVEKKLPNELKPIGAEIKVVEDNKNQTYGYKIGVDADGVVHTYKGVPIQKIFNIWDNGTADGKIPRTRMWSAPVSKLKYKYERATERFYGILDQRFNGHYNQARNSGGNIQAKVEHYKNHKTEYLTTDEYQKVKQIQNGKKLGGE